jgi:hypothetical protein
MHRGDVEGHPLFDRIRFWLRRRRTVGRFSSYVDRRMVDYIIDHPDEATEPPAPSTIDYVLALVRDDDLHGVPELLDEIARLARAHGCLIEFLASPLVFLTFGVPHADPTAPAKRHDVVAALATSLGDRVRILHGRGPALVGTFAPKVAASYGSALRGFSALLKELTGLAPGEIRQVETQS